MELERVLFVIVLYRQALRSTSAFQSLSPLMAKTDAKLCLFIYDNSPTAEHEPPMAVHYVHDATNPGVSRAYNVAFKYAQAQGLEYLFIMDQDSAFPETIFPSYRLAVAANAGIHVFAPVAKDKNKIYSPFKLRNGRGVACSSIRPGVYSLKHLSVINSGLLVRLTAFEKCGGYDERFPLDFSDINFCERLANNDFKVCIVNGSIQIRHSSSNKSPSKARFDTYLKALSLSQQLSNERFSYWLAAFPRAAKLFLQTRDRWFLQRFFNRHA